MINVCVANNLPVVHFGLQSFFKNHDSILVVAYDYDFLNVKDSLLSKKVDVLILDLKLDGLSTIFDVKNLLINYPNLKILIYSAVSEKLYFDSAFKVGFLEFVCIKSKLEILNNTIIKLHSGTNNKEEINRKKQILDTNQKKKDRLYPKISSREIDVLNYLNEGKKNNEIAQILCLDEKTVSTYKIRLLKKLNANSLIELINKAKVLEIL